MNRLEELEIENQRLRTENRRLRRGNLPESIPDCWEVVKRFEDATPAGELLDGSELRTGVHERQGKVTGASKVMTSYPDRITWVRHICPTCREDEVFDPRHIVGDKDNAWAILRELNFIPQGDGTWRRSRK